jgi:sugar phosphate isomerase/epimerase
MERESSCRSAGIRMSRRQLTRLASWGAVAAGTGWMTRSASAAKTIAAPQDTRIPLKFGHRAANMKMLGNFDVFKMARRIPGLMGVELQVASGNPNLRDMDTVRRYKREANRWGIMIPSVAGPWDPGVSILQSAAAESNLAQSIRVAELLGSSVVLVPFFQKDAPDMSNEASYGPVVQLLQRAAPSAADAGVTLGLENSLSPGDNAKLLKLVNHPSVKVYYDIHNMAHYGHTAEAISGIKLLGRNQICQVHIKNRDRLIEEPGLVDWSAALRALSEIGYAGWYVFESDHKNSDQLIDSTEKNIAFLRKHTQMPVG